MEIKTVQKTSMKFVLENVHKSRVSETQIGCQKNIRFLNTKNLNI